MNLDEVSESVPRTLCCTHLKIHRNRMT